MMSYLAGQFAGAQVVLHGQRLSHVSHRLVDLLQVTLVFHLQVALADTVIVINYHICVIIVSVRLHLSFERWLTE